MDARALALFDDSLLRSAVRKLDKLELGSVRQLTRQALARMKKHALEPIAPIEIHRRLVDGLAGESLLVSAALFLETLTEAERFFGLSFKTLKSRLGGVLDASTSERALHAARATMTAADVLGDDDAARLYMHTRNFALGGATPADLLKTSEGARIVLDELQTHAEGGPI